MSTFRENSIATADALNQVKIIPVLALESVEDGIKICEIFDRCGLYAAEITFRTKAAPDVIKEVSARFPKLLVGAGTVLNVADLEKAFNCGAKFAVAPGFNPTVVKAAVERNLAFAPGIATPSEVEQAYELGCSLCKFFPAEAAGGLNMIKSIIAPYKHLGLRFMPTGGVTANNAPDYLSIPQIVAVGGTWLGKADDIKNGNWQAIEDSVKAAVEIASKFKK